MKIVHKPEASVITHAFVFLGERCWGFTHDPDAKNLPADRGPWSFFRNARIPPVGEGTANETVVLLELIAHGFSVRPLT